MDQYIRITNKKMIYLNSSCAKHLGERCDLYECGNVTAFISAPFGKLHLAKKSEQCQGKILCSEELVKYLINKYKVPVGARLLAWAPDEENVGAVFFATQVSNEEAKLVFSSQFKLVSFPYQKRYGDWVYVEDRCISFTEGIREVLLPKLTLFGDGVRIALVGSPDGEFTVDPKKLRKGGCIKSASLSDYCRTVFGNAGRSVLFHARLIKNGVCFALREEDLLPAGCNCTLPQLKLPLCPDMFVSINNNFGVYLSSHASRVIGRQLSLYYAEGWLALSKNENGDIAVVKTGYQNCIFSLELKKKIAYFYPGNKKLFLLPNGPLYVLVPQDFDLGSVPLSNRFSPIFTLSSEDIRNGKAETPTPSSLAISASI